MTPDTLGGLRSRRLAGSLQTERPCPLGAWVLNATYSGSALPDTGTAQAGAGSAGSKSISTLAPLGSKKKSCQVP